MEIKNNPIELDDGGYLINDYGRYSPDLTFLSSCPEINWSELPDEEIDIPEGDYYYIRGSHFVSRSGKKTKCFRVITNGHHILLSGEWTEGFKSPLKEDSLYFKKTPLKEDGVGLVYAIFPYDKLKKK